jgi:hypothetical protein
MPTLKEAVARKKQLAGLRKKHPEVTAQLDAEDAAKQHKPHTDIGVADQFTSRSAQAIAHRIVRGVDEEFSVTELQVTVEAMYGNPDKWGVTPETVAFVKGTVHSSGESESREFAIQHLQLGDLPLLVLALQEAIRLGDEQGSFAILSPNANEIAAIIRATMTAPPKRAKSA